MSSTSSQPRRWGDSGTAWRWLAAILGGILLAGAFPPIGFGFLAPFGVAAITLATATTRRLRGAVGLGIVAGLIFFGILLRWMSVLGTDAWLALALYCALWFGLVGLLTRVVVRLPYWPAWVGAAWVTQEALRDRYPFGGFPWGRLAFSQSDSPTLGLASVGGAPLITAAVAVSGALLAWVALALIRRRSVSPSTPHSTTAAPVNRVLTVAVLAAIGVWLIGLAIPRPTAGESAQGPSSAVVALVQGSVPNFGLDAMSQRRAVLNNHVLGTKELAAQVRAGTVAAPELVIWPENSTDIDPLTDESAAAAISSAADDIGVPILVGAVTRNPTDPTTLWNVGIVWE
ncbi:MAG: apolipoprotein N-acyltransferase, partial [Actinobacteria bacterium]|nr:apolipoprotein N-acyltransferase [Actinomycetota bacterium]